MIETLDQIDVDQLYRDLATARGEATQAIHWRTRFQASEKSAAKLKAELLDALRRANAAEAKLAELGAA